MACRWPARSAQGAGTIAVTGSGDISPDAGNNGNVITLQRGLIRVSLTAVPHRGQLLAAKAVVIGAVGFVAGVIAAALALAIGTPLLRRTGDPLWPVSVLTEARMIVGTGALLAAAAVLALAVGTIARRSAPAVAVAIVVIIVPYQLVLGPLRSSNGEPPVWPLQITPAAALAVQQAIPQFYQVIAVYQPDAGYYPLAPWAGLAVECAWAAAALALAYYLLRRRDA